MCYQLHLTFIFKAELQNVWANTFLYLLLKNVIVENRTHEIKKEERKLTTVPSLTIVA